MKKNIKFLPLILVACFALLTAFYTKPPDHLQKKDGTIVPASVAKKWRVCIGISIGRICIGIEISGKTQGVDYGCNSSQNYCTVTADEADVYYDPSDGNYYVNIEDVISTEQGDYEEF